MVTDAAQPTSRTTTPASTPSHPSSPEMPFGFSLQASQLGHRQLVYSPRVAWATAFLLVIGASTCGLILGLGIP
eukprot:scaffold2246_cov162-Amphora_coffeaeformis.AAC.14